MVLCRITRCSFLAWISVRRNFLSERWSRNQKVVFLSFLVWNTFQSSCQSKYFPSERSFKVWLWSGKVVLNCWYCSEIMRLHLDRRHLLTLLKVSSSTASASFSNSLSDFDSSSSSSSASAFSVSSFSFSTSLSASAFSLSSSSSSSASAFSSSSASFSTSMLLLFVSLLHCSCFLFL